MYYVVEEDRADPPARFIRAQFSRHYEAEGFVKEVGGDEIVEGREGIEELVEAWDRGDTSQQAHSLAGGWLATIANDLENGFVLNDPDEAFLRAYAATDPLCAVVLELLEHLRQAHTMIARFIPPDASSFHGVHVRGIWEPSPEFLAAAAESAAKRGATAELVDT